MVEKISNYLLDYFLYKDEKIEGDQREIMLFGITRIVEDIPKYLFVLLVSILTHVLPQTGIVLCITILYKSVVGGAHARTNIECFIFTTLYFFVPVIIGKFVNVDAIYVYAVSAIILLYSYYTIYKHVPADTEEVPILKKEKRKKYKLYAVIIITFIYAFTIVLSRFDMQYTKIILVTVLLVDLFTSKIVYKLLRCKHSFESDEFKDFYYGNKE